MPIGFPDGGATGGGSTTGVVRREPLPGASTNSEDIVSLLGIPVDNSGSCDVGTATGGLPVPGRETGFSTECNSACAGCAGGVESWSAVDDSPQHSFSLNLAHFPV